jgi:hypothetical protein
VTSSSRWLLHSSAAPTLWSPAIERSLASKMSSLSGSGNWGLRTRGFCGERHAKDGGLWRVALQVQIEQLEQQVAALRSDSGADVPLIARGLLQLQRKGETTQSVPEHRGWVQ